jgi:hypothetical protein
VRTIELFEGCGRFGIEMSGIRRWWGSGRWEGEEFTAVLTFSEKIQGGFEREFRRGERDQKTLWMDGSWPKCWIRRCWGEEE